MMVKSVVIKLIRRRMFNVDRFDTKEEKADVLLLLFLLLLLMFEGTKKRQKKKRKIPIKS